MRIGSVKIKGFCALAPMAGVADEAFRALCVSCGASFCVSEMVSAKALTMNDEKSKELMYHHPNGRPFGIQLFGSDPAVMAEGARIALAFQPDFIDINMGCPAPKIIKNSSGSALLKNPALAGEITKSVKLAVPCPVTVKFRIGWDENNINCVEIAKVLEASGADALTVHGRTRAQMYAPPVDLKAISNIKKAMKIPVIGNGDIFTPADAQKMYNETACDLIMAGRGALGRPWLFSQINEYLSTGSFQPDPSPAQRMEIMMRHAEQICALKGERIGINEVRKHALWYTKGLRGSAKLRNRFSTVSSLEELNELAKIVSRSL